jgi:hypothetical protein
MTKTTNFEISKKLAEIGFYSDYFEPDYLWIENKGEISCVKKLYFSDYMEESAKELYKSYDLETLLDALPKERGDGYFRMSKDGLWCEEWRCPRQSYYYIEKLENESLANTAGRMIILLHEKKLIKF